MAWKLAGEYFENCSCEILCPCITSSLQGPADYERCQVPLVLKIREGAFEDVSLDGLVFIMVVDSPRVMGEGGWRVACMWMSARTSVSSRRCRRSFRANMVGRRRCWRR